MARDLRSRYLRHLVSRKESLRTTWKLRLAVLLGLALAVVGTRGLWSPLVARSLVCGEEIGPSDVILVENFDPDYLLFERAAALEQAGLSARVLVPAGATRHDPEVASTISRGIAELMARVARLENVEMVPVPEIEPISLNAAYRIRALLLVEHVGSVSVVTPGFRSGRSALVHGAVLGPAGVRVRCVPVFGVHTPENWTATWHGIQDVTTQFVKLQYYRFHVLPWRGPPRG